MTHEQTVREQGANFLTALQEKMPRHEQVFLDEVSFLKNVAQQVRKYCND